MAVKGHAEHLPDTLCKMLHPVKTILNPLYHYASDNNESLHNYSVPFRTCVKYDSRWPRHPVCLLCITCSGALAIMKYSRWGLGATCGATAPAALHGRPIVALNQIM